MRLELALVPVVLALLGCGMFGMGGCPKLPLLALKDGLYKPLPPRHYDQRAPAFAHTGATNKSLNVDRASGIVEVRYDKGGQKVVERWRIKSVTNDHH
jgi:hypothetical protein